MRNSQVEKLDRASYLSSCLYALKKVSWTTSSASCSFPVIRKASRKMARLCCSTSNRKASLSPDRARSTAPPASTSIQPLDYFFSLRLGAVSFWLQPSKMTGLRFQCQPGCTKCCEQKGFVYLTEADLTRIAGFLGMAPADFERRY